MSEAGGAEAARRLFPHRMDGSSAAPSAATPEAAVTDNPAGQSEEQATTDRVEVHGVEVTVGRYGNEECFILWRHDDDGNTNQLYLYPRDVARWHEALARLHSGSVRIVGVVCEQCDGRGSVEVQVDAPRYATEPRHEWRECPTCRGARTFPELAVTPPAVRIDDQPRRSSAAILAEVEANIAKRDEQMRRFVAGEDLEPLPRCHRTPALPGVGA